ncbi:MAG: OmpA family protein [Prevotella sp.]|nr:OmpA family protein [Prevotella sp.]
MTRIIKTYHLLMAFLAVVLMLHSCAADNAMRKGEKFLAIGEYHDAAEQFKKAYTKTPTKERQLRGQRALKMAHCYRHISSTQKAISAYRNALRYNVATLDDRLDYARLLLKNGEYKRALTEFELLNDSMPNNVLVRNGLLSAKMAPKWKEQGSDYTVKKMTEFNSRRADYCPVLAGDQWDRLYFSSTRNDALGDELSGITGAKPGDIFFSDKDDKGKWSKPQTIESGLNTEYDEGACCLSPDGSTMYLTQCLSDASYPRFAQIVTAQRSDASWGKTTPLIITNDTLSSYAHPAISPDGEWLYFVSDMPGGKGGLDIWRMRLTANGPVGVENLGEPINTPGDEMFPTFRPNGDFYFSSDGHPGFGGLDIFIATVGEDGKYHLSHPGYPLNSQGDDFGMTFQGQLNQGFFSSNRGDGRGWDHIYSFYNPEIVQTIRGWIYEQDGYELTAGEARIVGTDGTNLRLGVRGDGSFEYVVKPGVDYIILAMCDGFLNHKEEIHVDSVKESKVYDLQFPLASISAPVLIDNIFYAFDKATLLPESKNALDSLILMLNENPNITIELSAHTDYRGAEDYNKKLSQKRAESVVKYLINHGIAADRLTAVGYGEEKPKTIRRKVAERYPWLKENDVLTEEFILKLKPEQQETANALNRRTEFKVLRTTYNMFDKDGNLKNPPKKPVDKEVETDDDTFGFDLEMSVK